MCCFWWCIVPCTRNTNQFHAFAICAVVRTKKNRTVPRKKKKKNRTKNPQQGEEKKKEKKEKNCSFNCRLINSRSKHEVVVCKKWSQRKILWEFWSLFCHQHALAEWWYVCWSRSDQLSFWLWSTWLKFAQWLWFSFSLFYWKELWQKKKKSCGKKKVLAKKKLFCSQKRKILVPQHIFVWLSCCFLSSFQTEACAALEVRGRNRTRNPRRVEAASLTCTPKSEGLSSFTSKRCMIIASASVASCIAKLLPMQFLPALNGMKANGCRFFCCVVCVVVCYASVHENTSNAHTIHTIQYTHNTHTIHAHTITHDNTHIIHTIHIHNTIHTYTTQYTYITKQNKTKQNKQNKKNKTKQTKQTKQKPVWNWSFD